MKISYGLRAFFIYFIILGSLLWFTLDNAVERLNDGMRQSAESVLVDMAHVVASFLQDEIVTTDALTTGQLGRVAEVFKQREFEAKIYQVTKRSVDSQIYVTDAQGQVVFDSGGLNTGKDFSRWRDVSLTLQGEYGARTSFMDPLFTEPDDPKVMIVAAPILYNDEILGVVSVAKPINSLEGHLVTESQQLQRYALLLLGLALLIGFLLSMWLTRSLNRIANYANDVADGKQVAPPVSYDVRLMALTDSISHMRRQLDGKEYVENYIHSLTHELKTPLTSIRGAVELLGEEMPPADRERFLSNISTSNQRMSRLVDRMLSLAKLEGLTQLVSTEEYDLIPTIQRLVQERSSIITANQLRVSLPSQDVFNCSGDRVLISQAIANLLDNAIAFCSAEGEIDISLAAEDYRYAVIIFNQGDPIPEFAINKLYDRFFSLPRPDNKDGLTKSTGLGLSFVKEIMKLHQGEVKVENVTGGVQATIRWV